MRVNESGLLCNDFSAAKVKLKIENWKFEGVSAF